MALVRAPVAGVAVEAGALIKSLHAARVPEFSGRAVVLYALVGPAALDAENFFREARARARAFLDGDVAAPNTRGDAKAASADSDATSKPKRDPPDLSIGATVKAAKNP